jgi:hypothetical protein
MAFPVVAARNVRTQSSNATSFAPFLPAGIVAGDLLLLFVGVGGDPASGALTWPDGWLPIANGAGEGRSGGSSFGGRGEIRYRIADGSEGASITVTSPITGRWISRSWRIQKHRHTHAPPEIARVENSTNPPSLSPSWGREETLWIVAHTRAFGADTTGFPSSYTDGLNLRSGGASATDISGAVAERLLAAATEDPDNFVVSGGRVQAFTIAIRGAGPTVYDRKDSSATGVSSIDVTMPDGIEAGDTILAAVASSVATAYSATPGWTVLAEGANGGILRGAVLHKQAVGGGGDTLTVSGGSGNWRARAWGIRGSTGEVAARSDAGSGANNNPAQLATGWAASPYENLWFVILPMSTEVPSAAPSGFDNFLTAGGSGAFGLSSAERRDSAVTLDPSSWTSPSSPLRSFVVAVRAMGLVEGAAELPVPAAAGSIYDAIVIDGAALLPVPEADGFVYDATVAGAANLPVPVALGFVYTPTIRPFRVLQHLLPRALAWRTTINTALRRYLLGLGRFAQDVRQFIDLVYLDLFPPTTRELDRWATQFALSPGDDTARRLALAGAWRARGGQSPDYLQQVIHAAGFTTVFIHEWWESTDPFVARDPRDYTEPPIIGEYQCEGSDPWECFDPGPGDPLGAHCEASLANDPGYLVNLDLTRRPPPPIPSDPDAWRYFLYFAGEEFPDPAVVDPARLDELKALLLSLCPAQQWIVLIQTPPP